MQTMITTLTVRVPIGIESMARLAEITHLMKEAYDGVLPEKDDGNNPSVTLTQTVESDQPMTQVGTPAPRRRGPNKAKPVTVQALHEEAKQEEATKDTSKAGTEVTQPAWKVQASSESAADPAQPKRPPFLDRTADAKTKAA